MSECTAPPVTLTDFLLARIAEDEAVAREARQVRPDLRPDDREPYADPNDVEVRFPPGRVLAECEAKRQIVEWHAEGHYCTDLGNLESWYLPDAPCPTLCALATVYADHPNFRAEWRP